MTEIVDDAADERLHVEIDGVTAELFYEVEDGALLILHTEVPSALEGHGVGGSLVRAALDRARRDGLTVVPWCPFARRWMHGHADAIVGVEVDWTRPPPSTS
jgi:predicted GNAT family acetyltransferase